MSFDVSEMAENIAFPGSLIEHQSTTVDISDLPCPAPARKPMKLTKTTINALSLPEGVRSDYTISMTRCRASACASVPAAPNAGSSNTMLGAAAAASSWARQKASK